MKLWWIDEITGLLAMHIIKLKKNDIYFTVILRNLTNVHNSYNTQVFMCILLNKPCFTFSFQCGKPVRSINQMKV